MVQARRVGSSALNAWRVGIFKIIGARVLFCCGVLDLPPPGPGFAFINLKKKVQEFHGKFVLAPAEKAAKNDVVTRKMYYINTLGQELGSAKAYEHNLLEEKYVVDRHRCHMAA